MKKTKITISPKTVDVNLPAIAPSEANKGIVYNPVTKQLGLGDAGGTTAFDGTRQITRAGLPNIVPGGADVATVLENLLYPAVAPSIQLSVNEPNRQFGGSTAVTLTYVATKQTLDLALLKVDGTPIAISAGAGSITGSITRTLSPNTAASFTAQVSDTNNNSNSSSVSVNFYHKRYWFLSAVDYFSTGTDGDLSTLIQGVGNEDFIPNRQRSEIPYTPAAQYVYFVYSKSLGQASFRVNQLNNTDWRERVFAYKNSDNYTSDFYLYRSGQLLNGTFTIAVN